MVRIRQASAIHDALMGKLVIRLLLLTWIYKTTEHCCDITDSIHAFGLPVNRLR
jgi:hypothetical protein